MQVWHLCERWDGFTPVKSLNSLININIIGIIQILLTMTTSITHNLLPLDFLRESDGIRFIWGHGKLGPMLFDTPGENLTLSQRNYINETLGPLVLSPEDRDTFGNLSKIDFISNNAESKSGSPVWSQAQAEAIYVTANGKPLGHQDFIAACLLTISTPSILVPRDCDCHEKQSKG